MAPSPPASPQVFVQQKTMEVAGLDATLVVQVFVEGTKAAVQAATASGDEGGGAAAVEDDGATAAPAGQDGDATAEGAAAKPKKPAFDGVVLGIAVAEPFPDGRLK